MGSFPKKKKKAALLKDSGYGGVAEDSRDEITSVVTTSASPYFSRDLAPPLKKRKRKADLLANGDPGSVRGDSAVPEERDTSITVAPPRTKPTYKKQKLQEVEVPGPLKKSQISKFKDRDSPTPANKKADGKVTVPSPAPTAGGKYPPGSTAIAASRGAISPPPPPLQSQMFQAKAMSPGPLGPPQIPASRAVSASPKVASAKLGGVKGGKKGEGTPMRKVKSAQGAVGQTTPKMAKKALPTGVNVPAPGKATVGGLGRVQTGSPEKVRKERGLGNGVKAKGAKARAGERQGSVGVGVGGNTVPGKRAPPVVGLAGGGAASGVGPGDEVGGIPRKRPKVGE